MVSIKKYIFNYLNDHPGISAGGLIRSFPGYDQQLMRVYHSEWKRSSSRAQRLWEDLKWLYEFMVKVLLPGKVPSEVDTKRLELIEKVVLENPVILRRRSYRKGKNVEAEPKYDDIRERGK